MITSVCDKLYQILEQGQKFGADDVKKIQEISGLYFAFEKDGRHNGGGRVIRVGATGNLKKRITHHFSGSKNGDRFCECINYALKNNQMADTKKEVAAYLSNCYFVLVQADEKEAYRLKSLSVSTIANCKDCLPNTNWIGNRSGLFNERKLYGLMLDTATDLPIIAKNLVK
jgi:hypothetical protein